MPGFFVDRQDYGGDVWTDPHWNNLVCPTLDCDPTANPQYDSYYGFPRGAYDFWSSINPQPKGLFTYADDPCCCPELGCCFPNTVTATITGFQEATRVPSRSIGLYGCDIYSTSPPKTGRMWYLANSWCSSFIEADLATHNEQGAAGECCPDGYVEVRGMFWDNNRCYYTDGYKCCPDGSVGFADGGDARFGNCLSDCSPGEDGNIILTGPTGYIPCDTGSCPENNSIALWCCDGPVNETTFSCPKPSYIGLCGCNVIDTTTNNIILYNYGDCWTYRDIPWPDTMFPPQSCTDLICCADFKYDYQPNQIIDCTNAPALGVGDFYPISRSHISKQYLFLDPLTRRDTIPNYSWDEICVDNEFGLDILCTKPVGDAIIYGPNFKNENPDSGAGPQIWDGDHNGTYVCHKTVNSFRPELIPQIERSVPLAEAVDSDYQARLIYEVECRRKLTVGAPCTAGSFQDSRIQGFQCSKLYPEPTTQQIENGIVPNSKIYCVDYACGPRRFDTTEQSCGQYICSNNLGSAKPHLSIVPYNGVTGQDADIRFSMSGIHQDGGHYDAWVVNNVVVAESGQGYNIGDRFLIDFDTTWPLVIQLPNGIYVARGGQFYPYLFPEQALARANYCDTLLGENPNDNPITEKYGLTVDDFVAYPYPWMDPHPVQTLRVAETGINGSIKTIERVPWFLEREYNDGACSLKDNEDKTPYYPAYSRKLCHPQSVSHPGKGYAIGDKIIWRCASEQNCQVWAEQYATAYVVDIDDDGGILDWYINGGDHLNESTAYLNYALPYGYGTNPITYDYNGGLSFPCYGSSSLDFSTVLVSDDYDERGYYYYNGTDLCSLQWRGVGVPIRSRTNNYIDYDASYNQCFIEGAIADNDPGQITRCGNTFTDYNSGYLTSLNLSISRVTAETNVGITVSKYKYTNGVYAKLLLLEALNPDADSDSFEAIITFPPYPKCKAGGAKIKPIVYQCDDPYSNPGCGNESIFGGSLSGCVILSSGAYYAFVDRVHDEPILPSGVPSIPGSPGAGAIIGDFVFDKVDSFPHPDIFTNYFYLDRWNKSFIVSADRYAYFPLTSVTIIDPGTGYQIDDEFELYPSNGLPFTSGWQPNTGDDPVSCPNGGWYVPTDGPGDSPWGYVDPSGRWDYLRQYTHYDYDAPFNIRPLKSKAKIKITNVNEEGGITGLEIIESGMMFRTVETTGVVHPDISPYLTSTLGYGAIVNMVIESNKNSSSFGKVTNMYFTNPVLNIVEAFGALISVENYDPMHSIINIGQPVANSTIVAWSGNNLRGYGRDYANPENGYFWMLDNVDIDTGVKLLAYYPFGDSFGGPSSREYFSPHQSGAYSPLGDLVAYDYIHEEFSTHHIIDGSMPPYVPKSTICSFGDCYNSLLQKSYPLYRQWNGNRYASSPETAAPGTCMDTCAETQHPFGYGTELTYMEDGRPAGSYCVLLKNGKSITYDCLGDGTIDLDGENTANYAIGNDYIVVEYGFTMQLSYTMLPSGCSDYTDGRTWDGNYTAGYTFL